MMKSERLNRIERLFHQASSLPPDSRRAFLDARCAGDDDLRAEIEGLLHFAGERRGLLERPAIQSVAPQARMPAMPRFQGRKLGEYFVEREIGHGGMGVVFLARRGEEGPAARVAIKIAKPDAESRNTIARLLRERRLLSELDHPNITKLLDEGETEEGLPYLVMEFVEGAPLHRYCDAKRLSLRERAELLLPICEAIECAHRRGILHRDLKPTNVLVTEQGIPKLLDFGLAKRFHRQAPFDRGETTLTRYGSRALTPEYASPEQIRGEDLSPASDLYSLAVLAYELLAGQRPHEHRGRVPHEVERSICEDDPKPPSAAAQNGSSILALSGGFTSEGPEAVAAKRGADPRTLARELARCWDAILLRALRREPERRFASVGEFTDALREGLRSSWKPRARGVVLRTRYRARIHRARLVAIVILVSMIGGTAAIGGWIFDPSQTSPQQKVVVGLHEMGFAMHARGDDASSEGMYLLAREVQQRFFGKEHPSQASSLNALGALAFGTGEAQKSEKYFREALAILRRNLPEGHPELVATLLGLGMLLNDGRRFEESESILDECAKIAENSPSLPPWALPIAQGELGFARFQNGKIENGKRLLYPATGKVRELFGPKHEQTRRAEDHLRACN